MEKTVRKTSVDCFNQIRKEGLLSDCRFMVYKAIYEMNGCTASELFNRTGLKTNQSSRFTELRELGVIREVETRICKVTGRNAIEWDLTDRLPKSQDREHKKEVQYISIQEAEHLLNKRKKVVYVISNQIDLF
jgi:hypothetical protein